MPRTAASQRRATPPPPPAACTKPIGRIEQRRPQATHATILRGCRESREVGSREAGWEGGPPGLGKSGMTRMEDAIPATRASPDAMATAGPRRLRPPVRRALDPVAEAGPRGGKGGADAAAADGGRRRRRGWSRSGMCSFLSVPRHASPQAALSDPDLGGKAARAMSWWALGAVKWGARGSCRHQPTTGRRPTTRRPRRVRGDGPTGRGIGRVTCGARDAAPAGTLHEALRTRHSLNSLSKKNIPS